MWWLLLLGLVGGQALGCADEGLIRRLVGLAHYIRNDYPGGGGEDEAEYLESLDFANRLREEFEGKLASCYQDMSTLERRREEVVRLVGFVSARAGLETVQEAAGALEKGLGEDFPLADEAQEGFDFALGERLYQRSCMGCHGVQGLGDGPVASGLQPKPRSFGDERFWKGASIASVYNVLMTGIDGTAMGAFEDVLTVKERWTVAAYVLALPSVAALGAEEATRARQQAPALAWKETLHWNGAKMEAALGRTEAHRQRLAGSFRDPMGMEDVLGGLQQVRQDLAEARLAAAAGRLDGVALEQRILDIYLFGFQQWEGPLEVVDGGLKGQLERGFLNARSLARQLDMAGIERLDADLSVAIDRVHNHGSRMLGDFLTAAGLMFREGLEAFFVVMALLGFLGKVGQRQARRWVHAGWASAVLAGLGVYGLFSWTMQQVGLAREMFEVLTTGFAVCLLFYTGFWFLNQSERSRWEGFLKSKSTKAVSSGRLWGLFGVAFLAVFRESVETVMFFVALLRRASSSLAVWSGLLAGLMTLACVGVLLLRWNRRLPVRQMFLGTSVLMVGLSVVLAGKTVLELADLGWIHMTPLVGWPSIDALGLHPYREPILVQGILVGAAVLLAVLSKRVGSGAHG